VECICSKQLKSLVQVIPKKLNSPGLKEIRQPLWKRTYYHFHNHTPLDHIVSEIIQYTPTYHVLSQISIPSYCLDRVYNVVYPCYFPTRRSPLKFIAVTQQTTVFRHAEFRTIIILHNRIYEFCLIHFRCEKLQLCNYYDEHKTISDKYELLEGPVMGLLYLLPYELLEMYTSQLCINIGHATCITMNYKLC
jgi:hypothetical protein